MSDNRSTTQNAAPLSEQILSDIESVAVELARVAGAEVVSMLGRTLTVRYKGQTESTSTFKDPVSEVDHRVEVMIRARLAEQFPEHDILGEEIDERPGRNHDFVWAIDPVDGTANFVNGFPLFAAAIGVLHRGRPIVGAIWCSTSHALRPGVYHARQGGPLSFDEEPMKPNLNPDVRRRLGGEPDLTPGGDLPWETRKTGSAAIECAFVAAGMLRVARFARPNVWDVAGGIPLIRAAGGEVRVRTADDWVPMDRFEAPAAAGGGTPDLRDWRGQIIIGEAEAVEILTRARAG